MAHLTEEAKAFMNGLFNDYELSMDDIFRHQHFTIIKLSGINKIMAKAGINVTYAVEGCDAVRCCRCETAIWTASRSQPLAAHALRIAAAATCFLEMAESQEQGHPNAVWIVWIRTASTASQEEAHLGD